MNIFDMMTVFITFSIFLGIGNIMIFFLTVGKPVLKENNKKEIFIDLLNPFGNKISELNILRKTIYSIYGLILSEIFLIFVFYFY